MRLGAFIDIDTHVSECVCNVYVCTMCKRVGEGAFFSSQSFSTYRLASYSDTMMMMMLIHMPYQ